MIKNQKQVENKNPKTKARASQNWGLVRIPGGDLGPRFTAPPQTTRHSYLKKKKIPHMVTLLSI